MSIFPSPETSPQSAPPAVEPVVFRPAQPQDLAGIESLLVEIMTHHGVQPPSEAGLRETIRRILEGAGATTRPDHCFLVGEQAGEVVACCALLFSLSTWSAGERCELQDVVVTGRRRGEGIGRRLIDAAAGIARARGCVYLFLTAEAENLSGHAFYRSLGLHEKAVLYFERDLR